MSTEMVNRAEPDGSGVLCCPGALPRAGYLPVPLRHVPLGVLNQVPVYLKTRKPTDQASGSGDTYALYAAGPVPFTESDRDRLADNGIRLVYVRIVDQRRLQRALENCLAAVAADPQVPPAEASALVYETSFALVNEVLSDPSLQSACRPLRDVCQAISVFARRHENAFSHLFAAARHDFFTATHLVNVATWIVPLACQLGYRDENELNLIGQAGLLHDLGKVRVSREIINKEGDLTGEERAELRRHPIFGHELLSAADWCSGLAATVALQHHERMDGTGYPHQLRGDAIHLVSRMCAVADAFDAMTAVRPYKDRALTVPEALAILESETPARFDPRVVSAWMQLIDPGHAGQTATGGDETERREYPRFRFRCPACVVRLAAGDDRPGPSDFDVITHSLSRGGLGLFSPHPLSPGDRIRVYPRVRTSVREYLEGEVVRCRPTTDGSYDVGVEFTPEWKVLTELRASSDDR